MTEWRDEGEVEQDILQAGEGQVKDAIVPKAGAHSGRPAWEEEGGRVARGEVGVGLARQEELVFSLHATGMATGVHGCGARRQCGQMCLRQDHLSCWPER